MRKNRDVLGYLYNEKVIAKAEVLAGREWEYFYEKRTLQPMRTLNYEESFRNQTLYQARGVINEIQEAAFEYRLEMSNHFDREVIAYLDYVLCEFPTLKHKQLTVSILMHLSQVSGFADYSKSTEMDTSDIDEEIIRRLINRHKNPYYKQPKYHPRKFDPRSLVGKWDFSQSDSNVFISNLRDLIVESEIEQKKAAA